jgi:transcriptional regulator
VGRELSDFEYQVIGLQQRGMSDDDIAILLKETRKKIYKTGVKARKKMKEAREKLANRELQ